MAGDISDLWEEIDELFKSDQLVRCIHNFDEHIFRSIIVYRHQLNINYMDLIYANFQTNQD